MSKEATGTYERNKKAFKEGVEAGRKEGPIEGMLHDAGKMIRGTAVPAPQKVGRNERGRRVITTAGRCGALFRSRRSSGDYYDGGPGEGTPNTATRKSKIWTSLGLLVVSLYFLKGCSSSAGDYGLDALLGTIIWLPMSIIWLFLFLHALIDNEALYRVITFIIAAATGLVSFMSLELFQPDPANHSAKWLLPRFGILFGVVVGLYEIFQLITLKPKKSPD